MTLKYRHNISGIEIGVDEVGRGPLFGPVVSAAVIIDETFDITKVKDSKKFTSKKKLLEAYNYVIENATSYGTGFISHEVID